MRSRGILRRLGILDRDDETFRIRLRSTQQTTTVKGIRLGRGLSRSARTARRGGAVRAPGAGARAAIVKVQYMHSGRVAGYSSYMEKDKHKDSGRAVENYSAYMEHDKHQPGGRRAELFTRAGETVDRDAFVTRSKASATLELGRSSYHLPTATG